MTEGKLTILVRDWHPCERNTLQGFATVTVKEVRLTIRDVAVHEKNGKRWAQLPAKAQINRDRQLVVKDGKVQYASILEFETRAVADAFSEAVLRALDDHLARSGQSAA